MHILIFWTEPGIYLSLSFAAGEIISALNETGLLKSSLIIFTADHGELAMEHRQFYKMSMYEASSHVPLLIMGPNIKLQNVSNVVSLVDIYPTMLGKWYVDTTKQFVLPEDLNMILNYAISNSQLWLIVKKHDWVLLMALLMIHSVTIGSTPCCDLLLRPQAQ